MNEPKPQSTEIREGQGPSEQKGDALPVPEEAVEAALLAVYPGDLADAPEATLEDQRSAIREELEAAAPVLRKQGAEEERERLKDELQAVEAEIAQQEQGQCGGTPITRAYGAVIPRLLTILDNQEAS